MLPYGDLLTETPISKWSVNNGLVAWCKALPQKPGCFGGSSWYDLVNAQVGTLNGSGTTNGFRATRRPGGFGSWLGDGSTGYVTSTPTSFPVGNVPFSMLAWIKCTTQSFNPAFFMGYGNASSNQDMNFGINGVKLEASTHATGIIASTSVVDNVWHHAALVYSAGTVTIYRDAVVDGSGSVTMTLVSGPFQIGRAETSFYYLGFADDLLFFNRALSASEIAARRQDDLLGNPLALNWQSNRKTFVFGSGVAQARFPYFIFANQAINTSCSY